MRLAYEEQTEAFRAELIAWLDEHAPDVEVMKADPKASSADMPAWARAWQRRQFDDGWLVPGWPPELGGRHASPEQQMVYFEELARRDLPRTTNPQGLGIVAPSLEEHATPAQRESWLIPTLQGDVTWCIGMSEPGAGSDLAGLTTRAVQEGDEFVVDGQKVWTSGAHHADLCMCFVRTDADAAKHRGISVLVIPMDTPGITCRPLAELTDPEAADFNEVFFDGVRVPASNLVGALNGGWGMAMGSLGHERSMLWILQATTLERNLQRLRQVADQPAPGGGRIGDDPRFRDEFARVYTDVQALWHLGYKGFAKAKEGGFAPEHMVLKLYSSEVAQDLFLSGTRWLGADSLDVSDDDGGITWGQGNLALTYLRSFASTIAGGTSEIQRNIIAERLLGLPKG